MFLTISAHFVVGIPPTQSPTEVCRYVAGILPTQSPTEVRRSSDGFPRSETIANLAPLMGFPTRSPMLARSVMDSTPARRWQRKQLPTGPFSASLRESKPFAVGPTSAWSPYSATGISPP